MGATKTAYLAQGTSISKKIGYYVGGEASGTQSWRICNEKRLRGFIVAVGVLLMVYFHRNIG